MGTALDGLSCHLVGVCLGPGDIVLDLDAAPPKKKDTAPNFRPMSTVAKRLAGWIKIALGTEVGLGTGNIEHCVRCGPASPKGQSTIFWPFLLWPNGRPSQLL